jgi:hypothetical protein
MTYDRSMYRTQALFISLVAAGIVFVLWNIPQLDFLLYPFRLFVTFIHEAGHSLAAVFTGGQVISFEVFSNGGGIATTQGGSRALILPAGYLGAAFFGALLFYLVNSVPFPRKIALALGTFLILISLFMGARGIALIIGIITGLGLIFLGLRASVRANILVMDVLAIITGLNAVMDLLFLIGNSRVIANGIRNDAAAFTHEVAPPVPPVIWALIWCILAVFMLGAAVWYSVIAPLRREQQAQQQQESESWSTRGG